MVQESNVIETNPFDHILYEFSMYLQTSIFKTTDQFMINLLADSRMVHMRNLAYFFCSDNNRKKGYLHYTDYIQGRLADEIEHTLFVKIQKMSSNATCHLQKGRISDTFKSETIEFEQKVFPVFIVLIKSFITMARENVRTEYLSQWQNETIQNRVRDLEELIDNILG